ncbi:MAG: GGDEF domain-containing protein [Oscillospiraceae bacterium]|nr:GGDEF domain-containing protein [Oscillospiraceae bacterium]
MSAAELTGADFSVLFLDLDHFKLVNDQWGHDAGDQVLKALAQHFKSCCREQDIIGRVGGEEFSVFLPQTGHAQALIIAEKIRQQVETSCTTVNQCCIKVTVSIGLASRMPHHRSIADIQRDADHAMYHAKNSGRNRVAYLAHPCYVERADSSGCCLHCDRTAAD